MITNPAASLPAVQKTLAWFSNKSYYKVNKSKSYILNLGVVATTSMLLQQQFLYTWADKNITYLGVQLTKTTKTLFHHNYIPFRSKLQDLHRLASLEMSWMGCLAAFKMLHLPQILYLFRTLPIKILANYFKSLQTILSSFT